jgi:hypothetical protein
VKAPRALGFSCGLVLVATARCLAGVDTNPIPPLRPPRPDLPPGYWEQHGAATVAACIAAVALAALVIWRLTRPKPPIIIPPEVEARRALEALKTRPEDGRLLSEVSRILRRYVISAYNLPPGEMTTAEFCRDIAASESVGASLASALDGFMRKCDEQKFSPGPLPPALNATHQALALLEQSELRRAAIRQPAVQAKSTPAG